MVANIVNPTARITSGKADNVSVVGTLGLVINVPVTYRRALSTTDYDAIPAVYDSTGILGSVRVLGVTDQTTTGCTVRVQLTAIIAAGTISIKVIACTI